MFCAGNALNLRKVLPVELFPPAGPLGSNKRYYADKGNLIRCYPAAAVGAYSISHDRAVCLVLHLVIFLCHGSACPFAYF